MGNKQTANGGPPPKSLLFACNIHQEEFHSRCDAVSSDDSLGIFTHLGFANQLEFEIYGVARSHKKVERCVIRCRFESMESAAAKTNQHDNERQILESLDAEEWLDTEVFDFNALAAGSFSLRFRMSNTEGFSAKHLKGLLQIKLELHYEAGASKSNVSDSKSTSDFDNIITRRSILLTDVSSRVLFCVVDGSVEESFYSIAQNLITTQLENLNLSSVERNNCIFWICFRFGLLVRVFAKNVVRPHNLEKLWRWTIELVSDLAKRCLSKRIGHVDDQALGSSLLILLLLGQTRQQLQSLLLCDSFLYNPAAGDGIVNDGVPKKISKSLSSLVLSPSSVAVSVKLEEGEYEFQLQELVHSGHATSVVCLTYLQFFLQESLLLDTVAALLNQLREVHLARNPVSARRERDVDQTDEDDTSIKECAQSDFDNSVVFGWIQSGLQWIWESVCRRITANPGAFMMNPSVRGSSLQALQSFSIPHYRFLRFLPLLHLISGFCDVPEVLIAATSSNHAILNANTKSRRSKAYVQYEQDFCAEILSIIEWIHMMPTGSAPENNSKPNLHLPPYLLLTLIRAAPRIRNLALLRVLGSPGVVETCDCIDAVVDLFPNYHVQVMMDLVKDLKFVDVLVEWLHSESMEHYGMVLNAEQRLVGSVLGFFSHIVSDVKVIIPMLSSLARNKFIHERADVRVNEWSDATIASFLRQIRNASCNVRNILAFYHSRSLAAGSMGPPNNKGTVAAFTASNNSGSVVGKVLYQVFRYWSDVLLSLQVIPSVYFSQSGYMLLGPKTLVLDKMVEVYCTLSTTVLNVFETQDACMGNASPIEMLEIVGILRENGAKRSQKAGKHKNLVVQTEVDDERKLFGFEIIIANEEAARRIYLSTRSSMQSWIAAIERALHAQTKNIFSMAIHDRATTNSSSSTKTPSNGKIVVAEEWYEIQSSSARVWSPIRPIRFLNKLNESLPQPVFAAPLGWRWLSLDGQSNFPRPHPPGHYGPQMLGQEARVYIDHPGTTDANGWVHGHSLADIADDGLPSSVKISSVSPDGSRYRLRRRRWVRARCIDTSQLADDVDAGSSLKKSPVNSFDVFLQSGKLAAPLSWNLNIPPSPRDVLLTIVRQSISSTFSTVAGISNAETLRSNSSFGSSGTSLGAGLAKDLLATILFCGEGDDWDTDIQTILVESVFDAYNRLSTQSFRRECIRYLCERQLGAPSFQYQALFFSLFWIILSAEFELLLPTIMTSRYGAQELTTSGMIYDRDNFDLFSEVLSWLIQQWREFPSKWQPPVASMLRSHVDMHSLQCSWSELFVRLNEMTLRDITASDLFLISQESICWIQLVRQFYMSYERATDSILSVSGEDNVALIASDWWQRVDAVTFQIAKEFSFLHVAVLCGLRTPAELQAIRNASNITQLTTLCGQLAPAYLPLDKLIEEELKWNEATRLEVMTLSRICRRYFLRNGPLLSFLQFLQTQQSNVNIRWTRNQLFHGASKQQATEYDVFPHSKSCVPKEVLDSVKYLSEMDDWRNARVVQVIGATGMHSDLINGEYTLHTATSSSMPVFRCDKGRGFSEIRCPENGSSWEIDFTEYVEGENGIAGTNVVLANVSVGDVDTYGNECMFWRVNSAQLSLPATLNLCSTMRVACVIEAAAVAEIAVQDALSLFHAIWAHCYSSDVTSHLRSSITIWKSYKLMLDNLETPVRQIHELLSTLGNDTANIQQFLRVVSKTTIVEDLPTASMTFRADDSWVKMQYERLGKFQFFSRLRVNLECLLTHKCIGEFFDGFLDERGRKERSQLWASLTILRSRFTDDLQASELLEFHIPSEYGAALTQLQRSFILVLAVGKDLLEWMRDSPTIQSLKEFQVQQERIRGKDRSLLPEEIPDDDALTTAIGELEAIRNCFHEILYTRSIYPKLSDLLNAFLQFNLTRFNSTTNILQYMSNSVKIKSALVELFEADDDVIVPNKLLFLTQPERNARWEVSPSLIRLVSVTLKDQKLNVMDLDNLVDFQSKLNLSQSKSSQDTALEQWIESFNYQFKWIRLLQVMMQKLNVSGHPRYANLLRPTSLGFHGSSPSRLQPSTSQTSHFSTSLSGAQIGFTDEFPLSQVSSSPVLDNTSTSGDMSAVRVVVPFPYEIIRQRCIDAELEFRNWELRVRDLMQSYYFFNYFSINQIWRIISCLRVMTDESFRFSENRTADLSASSLYLQNVMDIYGFRSVTVAKIADQWRHCLAQNDIEQRTSAGMSYTGSSGQADRQGWFDFIGVFAHWVDIVFQTCTLRRRPLKGLESTKKVPSFDHVESGLNIILVSPEMHITDVVLSLYSVHGILPEREHFLLCDEEGSVGSVLMLLNRWGLAQTHNRQDGLFVVGMTERLKTEEQRALCDAIQHFLNDRNHALAAKLVLIVGGEHRTTQYISEYFTSFVRSNYVPLDQQILRSILKDIQNLYCRGATAYVSVYPGHGKTFQIRSRAQRSQAIVVSVPVHNSISSNQFVEQVFNVAALAGPFDKHPVKVVLHVDVGSRKHTDEALNSILLELVLLDGILHHQTGSQLPMISLTHEFELCIEISNWQQMRNLRLAELLPSVNCSFGRESLKTSLVELAPMLAECQSGYEQLQTVCKCLQLLMDNARNKNFPRNFKDQIRRMNDINPSNAFEMLKNFFSLTSSESAHRVWSLIRIVFAQLMLLYDPDSFVALNQQFMEPFFVYRTIQFFIVTAIDICQPAQATEREGELLPRPWQASNHEFICPQPMRWDAGGGLSFLTLQNTTDSVLDKMPDFREVLQRYGAKPFEKEFVVELNAILGTHVTQSEADNLLGGNNCITKDSVMKMIAIFIRLQNRVPVLLMGECGCGKTQLLQFSCAYWGVIMVTLDCHGGTSVADIEGIFAAAEEEVLKSVDNSGNGKPLVCVFLDEINTTAYVGLIAEVIMTRTLFGVPIHPAVVVVGALNPYRFRPVPKIVAGLKFTPVPSNPSPVPNKRSSWFSMGFRSPTTTSRKQIQPLNDVLMASNSSSAAPLDDSSVATEMTLVYKVHPIPDTLLAYILDFGSLEESTERLYVSAMITRELPQVNGPSEVTSFCNIILAAQKFIREQERDSSAVSLRDVKRCLQLVRWFHSIHFFCGSMAALPPQVKEELGGWSGCLPLRAYILGVALVYYYRLASRPQRQQFWEVLGRVASAIGWPELSAENARAIIVAEEELYCSHINFGDGIAKNQAVRENLFVTITCVSNKIPLMLVGKPGSSKTLTLQVIASNLNGPNSKMAFWKRFPSVTTFSYQCSPLSTAAGIEIQYARACSYQRTQESSQGSGRANDVAHLSPKQRATTVLLLDEIGLAEHSPDQPLKVLHKILPQEIISIVGISNWILDPAKMNRAILLSRPDPTAADLEFTSEAISNVDNGFGVANDRTKLGQKLRSAVSQAFHEVYTAQTGRSFFSMRDYYSLLKFIRRHEGALDWPVVLEGLCRNFGGRRILLERVITVFLSHWQPEGVSFFSLLGSSQPQRFSTSPYPVLKMIKDNLADSEVRHLMLISNDDSAVPILRCSGMLTDWPNTEYLVGSNFADDLNEHSLVLAVNKVKECMARGRTVVLLRQDRIYEALYDVLNMRTVRKVLKSGKTESMLRLAIGPSSQLCPVDSKFKLIVVVDAAEAYEKLDVPLLSRFEKQFLTAVEALDGTSAETTLQKRFAHELTHWLERLRTDCEMETEDIILGFRDYTLASLAIRTKSVADQRGPSLGIDLLISQIIGCLSPLAVFRARNSRLHGISSRYFEKHDSLSSLVCSKLEEVFLDGRTEKEMPRCIAPDISLTCIKTNSSATILLQILPRICGAIVDQIGRTLSVQLQVLDTVQVSQIKSEREFRDRIASVMFSTNQTEPALIVVHCDTNNMDHNSVRHVRFILDDMRQQRLRWRLQDVAPESVQQFNQLLTKRGLSLADDICVPVLPLHIAMVITDPPRRSLPFPLQFWPNWSELFCDDVRGDHVVDANPHKTLDLLELSTHQLCLRDPGFVERIIRSHFRLALASIRQQFRVNINTATQTTSHSNNTSSRNNTSSSNFATGENDISSNIGRKLSLFTMLLGANSLYSKLIASGVEIVLAQLSSQSMDPKYRRKNQIGKSLRESLADAFVNEVIFAFSLLIVILDRNFNMQLLDGQTGMNDLWLRISTTTAIANRAEGVVWNEWVTEYIRTSVAISKISADRSVDAVNDGASEVLVAQLPFSFALIRFMRSPETRASVMVSGDNDNFVSLRSQRRVRERKVHALVNVAFGGCFDVLMTNSNCVESYYHDFLRSEPNHFPSLTLGMQHSVRCALLRTVEEASFSSLGMLQTCHWETAADADVMLGLLNCLANFDGRLADHVFEVLQANICEGGLLENESALSVLHAKVLVQVLNRLLSLWLDTPLPAAKQCLASMKMHVESVFVRIERGAHQVQVGRLMETLKFVIVILSELSDSFLQNIIQNSVTKNGILEVVRSVQSVGLSSAHAIQTVFVDLGRCCDQHWSNKGRPVEMEKAVFLQHLFRGVVLDVVVPALCVRALPLGSTISYATTQTNEQKQALTTLHDVVQLLLAVICSDQGGPWNELLATLGPPQHFLRRSLLQFLLSSSSQVRNLLIDRLNKVFQGSDECPICYESQMSEPVSTSCNHTFCRACISDALSRKPNCPLCQSVCSVIGEFKPTVSMESCVDAVHLCLQWEQDMNALCLADSATALSPDESADIEKLLAAISVFDAIRIFGLERCLTVWRKVQHSTLEFAEFIHQGIQQCLNAVNAPPACVLLSTGNRSTALERYLYWPSVLAVRSLLRHCGETAFFEYLTNPTAFPRLNGINSLWLERLPLLRILAPKKFDIFFLVPDYGHAKQVLFNALLRRTTSSRDSPEAALTSAINSVQGAVNVSNKVALVLLFVVRFSLSCIADAAIKSSEESRRLLALLMNWVRPQQSGLVSNMMNRSGDSLWSIGAIGRTSQNEGESNEKIVSGIMNLFLSHSNSAITDFQVSSTAGNSRPQSVLRLKIGSKPADIFRVQVVSHIVASALQFPNGWLFAVLTDPSTLNSVFVPSMPDDEMAQILKGLDRTSAGARAAYRCECGLMYFIGNCGKAWEVASCPQCKRPIGGEQHNLVQSSKRIEETDLTADKTQKGYVHTCVSGQSSLNIGRDISPATVRLLRLFLHACLMTSCGVINCEMRGFSTSKLSASICNFIGGKDNSSVPNSASSKFSIAHCVDWCEARFLEDWAEFSSLLGTNDEVMAQLLHLCISQSGQLFCATSDAFRSTEDRISFERQFQAQVVENCFAGQLSEKAAGITQRVAELEGTCGQILELDLQAQIARADILSIELTESETHSFSEEHLQLSKLWRYRLRIDYDDFVKKFQLNSRNISQFPLLEIVIRNEDKMRVIRSVSAILQWHLVLFEVFPDGSLTRAQANQLTNADVISKLPDHRRAAGQCCLDQYIHAFNASFPHLEYIYECQENKFRNMQMTDQTSVAYSLPDIPKNSGVDASVGVCTVSLVQMLIGSHNSVLETLENSKLNITFSNSMPLSTEASTPVLLQSRLLYYDRAVHLLPLLFSFTRQGMGVRDGHEIDFDFARINATLAEKLISGKQKLALSPRVFQFMGEVQTDGFLRNMCRLVPQYPLLPMVEKTLRTELAVCENVVEMFRIVETAIRFLATSAVGRGIDVNGGVEQMLAHTILGEFVVVTLQVEEAVWARICTGTPVLRSSQVQLCHLARLHSMLDEIQSDTGQFSRVDSKYRCPLTNAHATSLRTAINAGLARRSMAALLFNVLNENLADNIALDPSLPLRSGLLDFIEGADSVDGYEHFPEALQVQHSVACFEFLSME